MLKVGIAAIVVLGLGFLFLHRPHDSSAERASSCLEKTGASVHQSSYIEDMFVSGAAAQGATLPEPWRKAAAEVDKHLYEVDYGGSSALLIFTKGGRQADTIQLQLAELSELSDMGPSTRFGNVLVLWPESPTDAASAAVEGCLS